jgi:hypothetical protein
MAEFYTTHVLVEVEVSHQFEPAQGIQLVKGRIECPAVKEITVLSATSNYRLHGPPLKEFWPVEIKG